MAHRPTVPLRMVVIISMIVAALLLLASAVQANGTPFETVEYRVQAGDSLWSIAADHVEGRDIRSTIGEIQRINELDGSVIYAGQTLELPGG